MTKYEENITTESEPTDAKIIPEAGPESDPAPTKGADESAGVPSEIEVVPSKAARDEESAATFEKVAIKLDSSER